MTTDSNRLLAVQACAKATWGAAVKTYDHAPQGNRPTFLHGHKDGTASTVALRRYAGASDQLSIVAGICTCGTVFYK